MAEEKGTYNVVYEKIKSNYFSSVIVAHKNVKTEGHKLLNYDSRFKENSVPTAALILIKQYGFSTRHSEKEWKTMKLVFHVDWTNENQNTRSKPINYRKILDNIKEFGYFNITALNLPTVSEDFFDLSTNQAMSFHLVTKELNPAFSFEAWSRPEYLGPQFPVKPMIKREGILIESFMSSLMGRIILKRQDLVTNSDNFYSFDWLFTLRELLNDCISSLDIVLGLIYNKAKFDPKPTWVFNEEALGEKERIGLDQKLKWVRKITGNPLDIEKQRASLELIKSIRNHLNHFDPPCFCLEAEECPAILNAAIDIAEIHIAIRKATQTDCSIILLNWSLQKPVIFTPEERFKVRAKMTENEGYKSCQWPI